MTLTATPEASTAAEQVRNLLTDNARALNTAGALASLAPYWFIEKVYDFTIPRITRKESPDTAIPAIMDDMVNDMRQAVEDPTDEQVAAIRHLTVSVLTIVLASIMEASLGDEDPEQD